MARAGLDVEFHLYPGAYHGFEGINPEARISQQALNEYTQAVKYGFERIKAKTNG